MKAWELLNELINLDLSSKERMGKPVIIYDGYKEYTDFDICVTDKAIWIEVHEDENG